MLFLRSIFFFNTIIITFLHVPSIVSILLLSSSNLLEYVGCSLLARAGVRLAFRPTGTAKFNFLRQFSTINLPEVFGRQVNL